MMEDIFVEEADNDEVYAAAEEMMEEVDNTSEDDDDDDDDDDDVAAAAAQEPFHLDDGNGPIYPGSDVTKAQTIQMVMTFILATE
ncbi:hypothetical protein AOXY_G37389 [Acipenser oxyrinchus oxyrinchus]|uniref:Uncharacterized protein n=1 Tax=Acipenser oxyrinchus oxyrinchus TaxID=40147 RepID=A0AAD8FNV3_ACIOX|nr:hypothetical protein AOXY_G37389 [Acipenser oxyrinchus oxyrinchus]